MSDPTRNEELGLVARYQIRLAAAERVVEAARLTKDRFRDRAINLSRGYITTTEATKELTDALAAYDAAETERSHKPNETDSSRT